MTAAQELHRRGWQVRLLDPSPVPRTLAASTDISKVVRPDYGADEIYVEMADAALEGWHAWNERWDPALYHEDGFLLLSREPMRPGGFEYESYSLLQRTGHALERLTPNRRTATFPAWSADRYPDGYFNPRAGWAECGKVLERLTKVVQATESGAAAERPHDTIHRAWFTRDGCRARERRPVRRRHRRRCRWSLDVHRDPRVGPRDVGDRPAGRHLEVARPAEWQAPRFPVWAADIARTGWYGFPALDDGTLKIGHHAMGRRVHPDEPRLVLPTEIARVRAFLAENLPDLAEAPLRSSRLCLYCDTFDGDFWIDHDPSRPGLFVAAGDSGHGFKFAPILGALIADVVEGRPNRWATRFRWRERVHDSKEASERWRDLISTR